MKPETQAGEPARGTRSPAAQVSSPVAFLVSFSLNFPLMLLRCIGVSYNNEFGFILRLCQGEAAEKRVLSHQREMHSITVPR